MEEIKKDQLISEIIEAHPDTVEVLMDVGLHCIGCPMRSQETLEQGCQAHGMSDEKIDELVKRLNETIKSKENQDN